MAVGMSAAKEYLTECFICKTDYTDPRLLPCIHTFCLQCLDGYRAANPTSAAGELMQCPSCQEEFRIPEEGFVGLKRNLFLQRLVKVKAITSSFVNGKRCDECFEDPELSDCVVHPAAQCCVQCSKFLCRVCSLAHRRDELRKDHCIVDVGNDSMHIHELLKTISTKTPCPEHTEEQVQMFCTDCQMFACVICLDENHQQHKIRSIKRIADDYQNQLGQLINDATNCMTGTEKRIQMLVDGMEEFQTNTDDCQRKILGAIEDLKRLVDAQGKALMAELLNTKQRQLKLLQSEVDELQTHRNLLDHFKNYCSEMKTTSTKNDLCDVFCNLSRRAKELQSTHDSDMQAITCFVTVLFEKTQMGDQNSCNIIGQMKETAEFPSMQREIGNQVMEDSTDVTMSDFEQSNILEPFMHDLRVRRKLHETPDKQLRVADATAQVSESLDVPNEPISSRIEPTVELKKEAPRTSAFELEKLIETTGPDWDVASSHISEFVCESSDDHVMTDIAREHSFSGCNNDLISELICRSTADFNSDFVPVSWTELQPSCVNRNVKAENVGNHTAQENSVGLISSSNPTGHSESSRPNFATSPIAERAGSSPRRDYIDNLSKKILEHIKLCEPSTSVTEEFCDTLTSDWPSDSRGKKICKSNYLPGASHNSFKSLESSEMQNNKRADVTRHRHKIRLTELGGHTQTNLKAWLLPNSRSHEYERDSSKKTAPSTDEESSDLEIEEIVHSFNPVTSRNTVETLESVDEKTSRHTRSSNIPLLKYVNVGSDISLGVVTKQFPEAEPNWTSQETSTLSNVDVQPADSTKSPKRKLSASKPKKKHSSKNFKGDRHLELIHKLNTGSSEIFGVTELQNKVYVLRKKSVSIYSIEDPKQPSTNIKVQNAVRLFDVCACNRSFSIYVTDYACYNEDKHCIWKITAIDHSVTRWYCGIGEPYTLSVNSEGNVILLRIFQKKTAIEILSDQAELIHRIHLPEEIVRPEHALETTIGSFVICHKRKGYDIWTVSEVSRIGEIVRRLQGTQQLSEPKHLALDAEDRVFIADWGGDRVAILGERFDWNRIVFSDKKDDKDKLKNPVRLCYVAEKKQLIVVSNCLKVYVYRVLLN